MNPGHDSAVLCNTGSIFGSKLFYGDFLMRSSREKKKKIPCMNEGRWMCDTNKWFLYSFIYFHRYSISVPPIIASSGTSALNFLRSAYASKANEKSWRVRN